MSEGKPQIVTESNIGWHNKQPEDVKQKNNKYKDLSTICIVPCFDYIPSKVVQNWLGLFSPMNQKFTRIFAMNMEVGRAFSETIEMILANPELSKWKFVMTLEHDNMIQPDCLIKLLEDIEDYDAVGSLYYTKGVGGKPMCFDSQTEVLTKNGWKYFKDVLATDLVATLTKENIIEYHRPIDKQEYNYSGNMIHWKAQRYDLMVTPDHALHCKKRNGSEFERIIASEMKDKRRFYWKKDGEWVGEEVEKFNISDDVSVSMDLWLEFLGYYISEGSLPKRGNLIDVRQCKTETYDKIFNVLDNLEFNPKRRDGRIQFVNKEVKDTLRCLGKAGDKYVPQYIFDLSKRQINLFLNALWKGDGSWIKGEWENYYSKSKQLADDVQHLLLLAGIAGTIGKNRTNYVVSTVKNRLNPIVTNKAKETSYEGVVYDLTVPNHTLYVRRNGRAIWSGNCYGDPNIQPVNFAPFQPPPNTVTRCNGLGMGATLFRMEMFKDKRIQRPLFETIQKFTQGVGSAAMTQDLNFFEKAGRFGYKFGCSTRTLTGHFDVASGMVW